jgi:hypothetical protein
VPSLGNVQLRYLEPDQIRRWYSTVLSDDRPTQRKHTYSLLRSMLREAEDEGLIERNPCRRNCSARETRWSRLGHDSWMAVSTGVKWPTRLGLGAGDSGEIVAREEPHP